MSACTHRSVGPVVKASTSRVADSGFDPRLLRGDFSGSSQTSDFKTGTPVATLPGVLGSALGLVSPESIYCVWMN